MAEPSAPARISAEAVPATGPLPDLGDIVHDGYNPIVRLIRGIEKPVICAVNGVAAGAGANLALACDILIAAEDATFIQSFAKIGLIPDTGGTFFLPRLVGLHRATAMMMLGERITAARAKELGIVHDVVPAFRARRDRALASRGRLPHRRRAGSASPSARSIARWAATSTRNSSSRRSCSAKPARRRTTQEGVRAFLEKRKPQFKGQ